MFKKLNTWPNSVQEVLIEKQFPVPSIYEEMNRSTILPGQFIWNVFDFWVMFDKLEPTLISPEMFTLKGGKKFPNTSNQFQMPINRSTPCLFHGLIDRKYGTNSAREWTKYHSRIFFFVDEKFYFELNYSLCIQNWFLINIAFVNIHVLEVVLLGTKTFCNFSTTYIKIRIIIELCHSFQ